MNKYSVGLDIGTNSVGWCVLDENSEIKHFRKKSMHGVRKTDGAETAEVRRMYRGSRRRLDRKKYRIKLLQELFEPMLYEVDSGFFHRLKTTFVNEPGENTYNLFVNRSYTDKQYYDEYPTIYHLRKELVKNPIKKDIRLVYLAIHHMIKSRGHFIYEGHSFSVSETKDIEISLARIFSGYEISAEILESVSNVLRDNNRNRGEKRTEIIDVMEVGGYEKEQVQALKALINGILNYKFNLNHLFVEHTFDKNNSISEIFNDESTEIIEIISEKVSEEDMNLLEDIHQVYSWVVLQEVLMGESSISDAKVLAYEKHENELKITKKLLKKYNRRAFTEIFKNTTGNSYEMYLRNTKDFNLESLNKVILSAFKDVEIETEDLHDFHTVSKELDQLQLLKRLKTTDNVSIPFQLNLSELEVILKNQGVYYPLLKENSEKIVQVLSFRIPYFVGPLDDRSEFSTAVRKSNERITPWNFSSVIDLEESAIKFIQVRTNRCTYLSDELVLPKKSTIVQDYEVLNELNGIKIDGRKLDNGLKQRLFDTLFLEKNNISEKNLRDWLESHVEVQNAQGIEITGFQKDKAFSTSRSTSILFLKHFKDLESNRKTIENLILWNTTIKDKKVLLSKLNSEYPELDDRVLDDVRKQNFDGWSRLSEKFLNGIKSKDGKSETILEKLYFGNEVLMYVISKNGYGFDQIIENEQSKNVKLGKISYDDVGQLAASPAVKQQIWQTIKLVEEIVSIEKSDPKDIFLEFAREEGEKKRTNSRLKTLQSLYSKISDENKEFKKSDLYKSLSDMSDTDLTNERLYLYFIQKGKCLYTGASLDINKLSFYEVDHIIPQSLVKNNSFDNKALVTVDANQKKGGRLGLNAEVIRTQMPLWQQLKKRNLMTQRKYDSLVRVYDDRNRDEFINGFINRQLVETRQITKHVVALLKAAYPNTNVVAIRAHLLSDMRHQYKFFKSRNLNDFHHAKDAYLTALFGQFMTIRFPHLLSTNKMPRYNIELNKKNKQGFLMSKFNDNYVDDKTGTMLWYAKERIDTMLSMMSRNDVLVTHQLAENKGEFYDQTIVSNTSNAKKIFPVNESRANTDLYGGYTSEKNSYMMIIEVTETKKNRVTKTKKLINIPVRVRARVEEYLVQIKKSEGYDSLKVINPKVMLNQLIRVDGALVRLSSATEWANAQQLVLPNHLHETLTNIERKSKSFEYSSKLLEEIYTVYSDRVAQYYPHYSAYLSKVQESETLFHDLKLESKLELIDKMLIVTSANKGRTPIKVEKINFGSSCGRLNNKNLTFENSYLISQSITGLFTTTVKL